MSRWSPLNLLNSIRHTVERKTTRTDRTQPETIPCGKKNGLTCQRSEQMMLSDPAFNKLADAVRATGRTLLGYDRLFVIYQSLVNLRRNFRVEEDINTAEVGVYKGGTSWFIVSVLESLGWSRRHHYCFDTFEGHQMEDVNCGIDNRTQPPRSFRDTSYEDVASFLASRSDVAVVKGRFADRCDQVQTIKFHFVHLDVDLYEPTVHALKFFSDRMARGGIIILDDYWAVKCPGVERVARETMDADNRLSGWFMGTEQYVLVRER